MTPSRDGTPKEENAGSTVKQVVDAIVAMS
jgi:hypothetical protein